MLAWSHCAECSVDIEEALGNLSAVSDGGERHELPMHVVPPFGRRRGTPQRNDRGDRVAADGDETVEDLATASDRRKSDIWIVRTSV